MGKDKLLSIVKNSPDMNITNQINAGLNDVRKSLVALSEHEPDSGVVITEMSRARYELETIFNMINEHRHGKSISWSDRRPQIEEEFS